MCCHCYRLHFVAICCCPSADPENKVAMTPASNARKHLVTACKEFRTTLSNLCKLFLSNRKFLNLQITNMAGGTRRESVTGRCLVHAYCNAWNGGGVLHCCGREEVSFRSSRSQSLQSLLCIFIQTPRSLCSNFGCHIRGTIAVSASLGKLSHFSC